MIEHERDRDKHEKTETVNEKRTKIKLSFDEEKLIFLFSSIG